MEGQLGDGGGTNAVTAPIAMSGVAGVAQVHGVNASSFLIYAADGSLRALGFVGVGGLGTGDTLRPMRPVTAPF